MNAVAFMRNAIDSGLVSSVFLISCSILIVFPARMECHAGHHHHHEEHKDQHSHPTLMISFDGFRWDYLNILRDLTQKEGVRNYFDELIQTGASAPDGIQNVFTTKTFPNHYTLVTGLYEESHGILGNHMYDPSTGEGVSLIEDKAKSSHLYGGEPIWVTYGTQRSQDHVGCYMWVGCDLKIKNFTLNRIVHFSRTASCMDRISWVRRWFAGGVQFVLLYFREPDATGHWHGPHGVNGTLRDLNDCLGKLLAQLKRLQLWPNNMNIMIVSDHGMMEFNDTARIKDSPSFDFLTKDYTTAMIQPKPGQESAALEHLRQYKNVKVYKHEEIPLRWHYRHKTRVPRILVVADLGTEILYGNEGVGKMRAGHGYDNQFDQMRPIFIASGPSFKTNVSIARDRFRTVDVYLLICQLFGLTPSPNNGSLEFVLDLLKHSHSINEQDFAANSLGAVIACSVGVLVFAAILFVAHRISLKRHCKVPIESIIMQPTTDSNGVVYCPMATQQQMFSLEADSDDGFEESN